MCKQLKQFNLTKIMKLVKTGRQSDHLSRFKYPTFSNENTLYETFEHSSTKGHICSQSDNSYENTQNVLSIFDHVLPKAYFIFNSRRFC